MEAKLLQKYDVVIGLEVHAQLLTDSKIYNSDSTSYGESPNQNVSVITLAHPGTLPKLNKKVIELAVKMGLACNSEISRYQIFDRKNYFYPDLPKGYQLTQDRTPICVGGYVSLWKEGVEEKRIALNRIHIEEDAGKSIHDERGNDTLLDFNRSGVPLIEIVTEPVIESAEDAGALLGEIRKLVRYLEICDGNMEEGSLRCDANISIKPKGTDALGKKVEVKNMNSIRNVQQAIEFETRRQAELLELGKEIVSETRTFDATVGKTFGMRTKEELNDYRYFPDPDLSSLEISDQWLEQIKSSMPALPHELYLKFTSEFGIPTYDAGVLTENREIALFFDELCTYSRNYKAASNWVMGPLKSQMNERKQTVAGLKLTPKRLSDLIDLVDTGKLNYTAASQMVFPELLSAANDEPLAIAEKLNLLQDGDEQSIRRTVEEVIAMFPEKVSEYKKGKKGLLSMFMGEVMKKTKGKVDPKIASELIKEKLN
ncbi:MAG: Asp-tRNA(Asn)/Glu-tRNA(Gln) amidotransferase subunit GatB [Cyclobacteriaceae bacterium]